MVQLEHSKETLSNAQMGARTSSAIVHDDDAERLLETAISKLGLSARAYSRVLKVDRHRGLAGTEISPPTSPGRFNIELDQRL
jgi:predicted ATPase with chaperone activity